MQGAISLTSEMGKGSNFSFYIHFDPAVQIEEEVSVSNNVSEVQPMKVLLVDDISVNRKVAGIMLKKLNCEFTEASNGLEALKVIDDESFDLVLMDIQMPEMDGVEALQKLKEKDSSSLPPVIALSANALEGDREKYLGLGFDDYIAKPITLKALRDHLGKVS
jgi:CheY-like chemotaxis protein